jgi:hypothetical protein
MGGSKLKRLRPILLGIVAFGIAAAALTAALRDLDWATFRVQLHELDWRWLGVAVAFDVASYAAQGVRWRCLLKQASLWQTTRAIYAGLFLNEIVPLRPGEAVRAWLAARDLRVGLLTVAPTMLTERLMDGVWLATALLATLAVAPLPASLVRAAWMVIVAMSVLLVTALLVGRERHPLLAKIRSGLSNRPALLASGVFLAAQGLAFWAVTRASHLSLGLAAAFVVMIVVRIGTMLPGAPANLGTHQYSTVLGLSLYGVPQNAAAGFSLVVFVVLTAPLLAIGFAACLNAGLDWETLRAASRPAEPVDSPLLG